MTLTLKTDNVAIILINLHAPTEENDGEKKEYFYETLVDVFYFSQRSFRIMLRDLNAKLDRETEYRNCNRTKNLHAIINDSGTKLSILR